jgi:hypothetical protein
MRDSVSFWVFDDRGELGLPRVGIEALSASWEAHAIQVNVAFPDGRVFRVRQDAPSWPAEGPDGRPTVLGAGPPGLHLRTRIRHLANGFRWAADVDVIG